MAELGLISGKIVGHQNGEGNLHDFRGLEGGEAQIDPGAGAVGDDAQTGDVDGQQEQQGADVQRFAEILEFAVIAQDHRRSGNKAKAVGNALDHNVPQDHLPVFIGDAGDHGNA